LEPKVRKFTEANHPFLTMAWSILGINITGLNLMILVSAVGLMFLLHIFIKYTKLGKAMRATADDMETASIVGINVDKVITATFVIGSALAAIGGIFWGSKYLFDPYMGILPGVKAFTAVVVGASIIGILNEVPRFLYLDPEIYGPANLLIFSVLIIVVVLFRPKGIMGEIDIKDILKRLRYGDVKTDKR
jgi:branched-chain amino acid transport system permease protein